MIEDRFEEFLDSSAREYHRPPETPRDAIWEQIQAARRERAASPANRPPDSTPRPVVDLPTYRQRRVPLRLVLGIAAVLALGVALGRLTLSSRAGTPTPTPAVAAGGMPRQSLALKLTAIEHLSRVESLLTDYQTQSATVEFRGQAEDLLSSTRLLLDSPKLTESRLRSLLEDLELILVQLTQLQSNAGPEERALIDDGLTQREIRSRLRNAIPAGPTA